MGHKWTAVQNPVEEAKERYRQESVEYRRRIAYCLYRSRRVGALKRRAAWRERAQEARRDLDSLQRILIRGLG